MRKLNIHNLLTSLNALCDFLHEAYNVNLGGCCFLAAVIARHLDRLGIEYNLVIYDYYRKDKTSIEHEVISCHKNSTFYNSVTGKYSCNHYCIQLKGAGIINGDEECAYQYVIPNVSYKNIRWIHRNSCWNSVYKVRHNKTIKNIVKEFFKEYEKTSLF